MTSGRRPSLKFGTQTTRASASAIGGSLRCPAMDLDAFGDWLGRYFAAWASNDPAEVAALFSEDAVYSYGPFSGEAHGREEIVRRWVQGGVQPGLSTWFEPLAVHGSAGLPTGASRSTRV